MTKSLRFLAVLLAMALTPSLPAQAQPLILHLGLQDNPSTLDPALAANVPAIGISHWLFNGLMGFDADGHAVGDLAERYTIDRSGKHYEFKLRKGIKFHDGRPLTAADVKYSLTRLFWPETKSPGSSFYRSIIGAPEVLAGKSRVLAGVSAPKPDVVAITLAEPQPTFLQLLGLNYAAIIPANSPSNFASQPIGTGPFRLKNFINGQRLNFERNSFYFKPGLPRLDGIDVELGLNEQVEALRFERGELDAIGLFRAIGAADFARLSANPQWAARFLKKPDHATHYIGMNTQLSPFDNVKVRQAVAMAVNKARLVQLVNGRGIPAQAFLPPTLPGADGAIKGYEYAPAKAKTLLAQAGFPKGFSTTYWCSNSATSLKIAQSIQQDLAGIGINVTLKPLAFPTFLAGVGREKNAFIFTGNWSQDYPDPENFLGTLFSSHAIRPLNSVNTTFFRDAKVDQLLDQAAGTPNASQRFGLYHQAERRILELAPVVPLYHPRRFVLAQPWVSDLVLHAVWPVDAERIGIKR